MPSLQRRTVLARCGAILVAGLAGCAQVTSLHSSVAPELREVTISNFDDEPHTAHVLILKDGEPVYSDLVTVEGIGPRFSIIGEGEFTGLPTNPGAATLYAGVDDQETSEWKRFNFVDYNNDCVGLNLTIQSDETQQEPTLSLFSHSECSTTTSQTET